MLSKRKSGCTKQGKLADEIPFPLTWEVGVQNRTPEKTAVKWVNQPLDMNVFQTETSPDLLI